MKTKIPTFLSKHLCFFLSIVLFLIIQLEYVAARSQVFINEIDPNTENGFVELKNIGTTTIDLSGWTITFNQGLRTVPQGTILEPKAFWSTSYTASPDLSRDDTITVKDKDGNQQDIISTKNRVVGQSYSRFINNPSFPQDSTWEWTSSTPMEENFRETLTVLASPNGGDYDGPIKIELEANKPDAKIFYAFSGDAPPDDQYEYEEPLTIEDDTELWFFALADSQQITSIQNEIYNIEEEKIEAEVSFSIESKFLEPKNIIPILRSIWLLF